MNRDERRTRPPALPPRVHQRNGVRFIAPVDPQGGGTWIGVNEQGTALCLVNRYDVPFDTSRPYASRGGLVMGLLHSPSVAAAIEVAIHSDLSQYPPFVLLALDPVHAAAALDWDTRQSNVTWDFEAGAPLVSSGYRFPEVRDYRRARLAAVGGVRPCDPELLWQFHCDGAEAPDGFTTIMSRPEAATMAFTWVTVDEAHVRLGYLAHAPRPAARADLGVLELPRIG